MKWFSWQSGFNTGVANMVADSALLEYVRQSSEPLAIIRSYGWSQPTLSLGVHQSVNDLGVIEAQYKHLQTVFEHWVRRPTGGRAILHGQDISYAIVTNDSTLLSQSVAQSYCVITRWLKAVLVQLDITDWEACSEQASRDAANVREPQNAYARSPLCMATHMPTDLLDAQGEKRLGSAQLRRSGGLLQHGSIFFPGLANDALRQVQLESFHQAFDAVLTNAWQASATPLDWQWLEQHTNYADEFKAYASSCSGMLANASTTTGSHLLPAS